MFPRQVIIGLILACAFVTRFFPVLAREGNPLPNNSIHQASYSVLNTYPHDPEAFTQGLVYHEGSLYEGTGLPGRSSIRKIDLETGNILKSVRLPDHMFGEGVTIYNDRIIQLTWKSRVALVYDLGSMRFIRSIKYPHEGWGITHDGNHLITSDGTSAIRFMDPETFREVRKIQVHAPEGPVIHLNELEYIRGEIYANVWNTDRIVKIDPETGVVTGWIDLMGLYVPQVPARPVDVLNGIAYDPKKDRLFVTGKLWPTLFEIRANPQKQIR